MKKYLNTEQGITLLELLIGMVLMVVLLSGMLSLFFVQLKSWTIEKNRTSMQQVVRIAVDVIMREVRYGKEISLLQSQSLRVTKPNGEMITIELGEGLYNKTLYMKTDKSHATPSGGFGTNALTENVVTSLVFTPYPNRDHFQGVGITMEVTDQSTGQRQVLHTVGYPWNGH